MSKRISLVPICFTLASVTLMVQLLSFRGAIDRSSSNENLNSIAAPKLVIQRWFNTDSPQSLQDLRGKVVLLDFWGLWCNTCVKELPESESLYQTYKNRGFIIIGVHSEKDGQDVEAFLKQKPISFPVAIDQGETAQKYGIKAWPTYFLIDKSGKVRWGFSNSPPGTAQIDELLR